MRRAILPSNQPEEPDQDLSGYSATDAAGALCGDATAQPQRAGAATTDELPDAHARRPAIQVNQPSERTDGRSSLLPALTSGDEAGGNEARQSYDLDLPHETGVYLLAIVREGQHCRYWHARHYLGWAIDIADRVTAHRRGKGASFTQALVSQGYGLWLVAWFPGDRTAERAIKLTHHVPRFCPLCRAGLCLIDQPPRHSLAQASSGAQLHGKLHGEALHVAGQVAGIVACADIPHVPDDPRNGQLFRQDHLLALTDDSAGDTGNTGDAGGTEMLVGDTLVEPSPPNVV